MLTVVLPTQTTFATVASFPPKYFLENLIVRSDNSVLITAMNKKEVWYVPPIVGTKRVEPVLLHTFDELVISFTEIEEDVFSLVTSNVYTDHQSRLYRIDLWSWKPGEPITPQKVLDFPEEARALNGSCLLEDKTLLVADSVAGLIWRVNLLDGGTKAAAQVWLAHESMKNYPGEMTPEQPGINGIRYASKGRYIYYSATAKKLFMRVSVDPSTLDPGGEPEHVSAGRMTDDFCIDEDAGVAYLTTHRENTIDCVSLNPAKNGERFIVAGDPVNEELVGPSSAAWSRLRAEYGKVAFVTTDGGTASPLPDGLRRPARLLRLEIAPVPDVLRSQFSLSTSL